jgi:iron complex outermembrane receptor protein
MDVGRLDPSQWAASARGFNDLFANKLLVLQDGRSIYTPLFSGVFWDVQGAMLEDIDRIEVIRGPGATLWGANAVNGVINIITKSARETQGTLISGGGGTEERAFGSIRYGGKLGENAFFRVYATYFNRNNAATPDGQQADDGMQLGRWGFRVDWEPSSQNRFTFQGEAYRGEIHQVFGTFDTNNPITGFNTSVHDEFDVTGGHLLGRWSHTFSAKSDLQLQMYYDRTERNTVIFDEKRDTFDIDFQHRFELAQRNDLVWGAGYRVTADKVGNSPTISLNPDRRTVQLFSGFVQDEIALIPERLRLTVGSKFEHNDYTGFEVQPGGRLLWTPEEHHTVWGSVSRAVRTPSRSEVDVILNQGLPPGALFPASPPAVITIYGDRDMGSEELLAYEIGYRLQPFKKLSLDLAAFYNDYDHLRSLEHGDSRTQPPSVAPSVLARGAIPIAMHPENKLFGDPYGLEAAATLELTPWWRIQGSYSFLEMQLYKRAGSTDTSSILDDGKSPEQQGMLRSSFDLPYNLSLDCAGRYVDTLPTLNIGSYVELDARLGWRPTKNLEVAVVGQNLVHAHHREFSPSFIKTQQGEIERGVYGKVTWRF